MRRHWNCNTGIIIFASLEMASHYIPASLGSWQCSSLAHLSGPSDHLPQGGAIFVYCHLAFTTGIIIFASLEMASHYIPASLGSWQCSSLAHLSGPLDHLPQGGAIFVYCHLAFTTGIIPIRRLRRHTFPKGEGMQKSPHEKEIPAQTIALKQPGSLFHADFSHPCFL